MYYQEQNHYAVLSFMTETLSIMHQKNFLKQDIKNFPLTKR